MNLSIAMRHGLLLALALFLEPWLFPFSNTVATGSRLFFEGAWGRGGGGGWGSANVGCLMAVITYMKLRLHILAESGPEKSNWLSRFGACECHKAHYLKTNRMQESIMGSYRYNASMKPPPWDSFCSLGYSLCYYSQPRLVMLFCGAREGTREGERRRACFLEIFAFAQIKRHLLPVSRVPSILPEE